jgi:hypothetical protein
LDITDLPSVEAVALGPISEPRREALTDAEDFLPQSGQQNDPSLQGILRLALSHARSLIIASPL